MPEIRATLPEDLHRTLKAEAAQKGKHLKDLIAEVLGDHAHIKPGGGNKKTK
jgi:hypothetical protein